MNSERCEMEVWRGGLMSRYDCEMWVVYIVGQRIL